MMKTQQFNNLLSNIQDPAKDIETQVLMLVEALRDATIKLTGEQKIHLACNIAENYALLHSWYSERYTFKYEAPPRNEKELDSAYMYLEISTPAHLRYTVKDQFNEVHSAIIPFEILDIPCPNTLPADFSQEQYTKLIRVTSNNGHTLSEREAKVDADHFIRKAVFFMKKAIAWGYKDRESRLNQLEQIRLEDTPVQELPQNGENDGQDNRSSPTFFADKRSAYKRKVAEIIDDSNQFMNFKKVVAEREGTNEQSTSSTSSSGLSLNSNS